MDGITPTGQQLLTLSAHRQPRLAVPLNQRCHASQHALVAVPLSFMSFVVGSTPLASLSPPNTTCLLQNGFQLDPHYKLPKMRYKGDVPEPQYVRWDKVIYLSSVLNFVFGEAATRRWGVEGLHVWLPPFGLCYP